MSKAEISRLVEEAGFIFRGKVTKQTRDIGVPLHPAKGGHSNEEHMLGHGF